LDWGQARALQKIDDERAARCRAERAAAVAGSLAGLANGGGPALAAAAPLWVLPAEEVPGGRGWSVNGQGQTLAVVEARQPFLMGSPEGDETGRRGDEKLHWRRIGRRYAIATRAVTVAQFRRFLKAHPEIKYEPTKQCSPEPDSPIIRVTWYEAAQYCRWLSEQEGFPEDQMVFPSMAQIEKSKEGSPLRLPADYLRRTGYQLPTEAEWEFACRAGARTSRYYGSSLELLPRYAWYIHNSGERTWPVGQKRPNDLGLFDMHGNAWTWCQESGRHYPSGTHETPARDEEHPNEVADLFGRVMRGGSFYVQPTSVRAASRHIVRPPIRGDTVGLRVARTLP
jgi:formylglycine-generating enzyme required for sulfatase activity